jgi:hypothetical protein
VADKNSALLLMPILQDMLICAFLDKLHDDGMLELGSG